MSRAVLVYVEEGATFDSTVWDEIHSAIVRARDTRAPIVQTVLVERRDAGSGTKVTLR